MSSRFARNSIFSTISGLCTALAGFASTVIVARTLGAEGTGTVVYGLWVVSMAVTFADLGLFSTLSRYLPEIGLKGDAAQARNLVAFLLQRFLAVTAIVAVIFLVIALSANRDPSTEVLGLGTPESWVWPVLALLFCLQSLANFSTGFLRGSQRFGTAALVAAICFTVQLLAVAAGALFGGVLGALLGYCAASILPAALVVTASGGRAEIEPPLLKRVARFAFFSWVGAITLAFVWSRIEVFFLQMFWGPEAIALFTIGLTFANLAAQGPMLLTGALLPYFSESVSSDATERTQAVLATGTRLMAFLLFPICFGTAAIIPIVLPMIYGAAYAEAIPAACIVVIAAAFSATGSVGSNLIYARERSDFIFLSGIVGASLSVASGLLAIPTFGVIGAATARAAIHAFMVAYGCWFIVRRLHSPLPFGDLGRLLVAGIGSALVAAVCVAAISTPAAALAVSIPSAAMVYVGLVRVLGALPAADVAHLQALAASLPSPAGPAGRRIVGLLSRKRSEA